MSYRSIKRVIGETSLERKCRFLFVACLTVLLTVTFWWVEHIAEDLVQGTAIRKSRDLVDAALLRYHWEQWEASDPNADPQHAKALRAITRELARDLQTQKYDWDILALEETPSTELPASEEEKEIMLQLKEALRLQMQTRSHQAELDGAGAGFEFGGGRCGAHAHHDDFFPRNPARLPFSADPFETVDPLLPTGVLERELYPLPLGI